MKVTIALILLLTYTQLNASWNSLDDKIKEMYWKENWLLVIEQCNKYAKNTSHCKITHAFVSKAESNNCKQATKHNCYWNSKYKFNSDREAIIQFNKTYLKYYWKNLKPIHFYNPVPNWFVKTAYCKSEESSNSKNSCPNGFKSATLVYNSLINLK